MNKIVVLGSKGMLGQMVMDYFGGLTEVVTIDERYTFQTRTSFLNAVRSEGQGVVINCIGRIKQKTSSLDDLLWVNSTLPLDLQSNIGDDQFLIHPSTDCVYDGMRGPGKYPKTSAANATDEYGWSKAVGEAALRGRANVLTIRVSIIGPDNISPVPRGMLGWFLSQPPASKIQGFVNHLWNGITTLEWCRSVADLIDTGQLVSVEDSLLQLGTNAAYTKRQMLDIFQHAYQTDYEIQDFETIAPVNRCLEPDILSPSLEEQMNALAAFVRP